MNSFKSEDQRKAVMAKINPGKGVDGKSIEMKSDGSKLQPQNRMVCMCETAFLYVTPDEFSNLPAKEKFEAIGIGNMYDFLQAISYENGKYLDKDLYDNAGRYTSRSWNDFTEKQKKIISNALSGRWTKEGPKYPGGDTMYEHQFRPYPGKDFIFSSELPPDEAGLGIRKKSHVIEVHPPFKNHPKKKLNLKEEAEQLRECGDLSGAIGIYRKLHPKKSFKDIAKWVGYGATSYDVEQVLTPTQRGSQSETALEKARNAKVAEECLEGGDMSSAIYLYHKAHPEKTHAEIAKWAGGIPTNDIEEILHPNKA